VNEWAMVSLSKKKGKRKKMNCLVNEWAKGNGDYKNW